MHYIHENMKWFREQHCRWTQQEIADGLSTTLGRVKTYEASTVPPVEMLMLIAQLMGITIDALIRVKLTAQNYPLLKKEKVKEVRMLDELARLHERLDRMERKVNRVSVKKHG